MTSSVKMPSVCHCTVRVFPSVAVTSAGVASSRKYPMRSPAPATVVLYKTAYRAVIDPEAAVHTTSAASNFAMPPVCAHVMLSSALPPARYPFASATWFVSVENVVLAVLGEYVLVNSASLNACVSRSCVPSATSSAN